MKHSSKSSYAMILEDHVLPTLGHIRIDEIRRSHLEQWSVDVVENAWRPARKRALKPYEPQWMVRCSRETIRGWWRKLKQLLKDACAEYSLRDVTDRLPGPKVMGRTRVQETRTLSWVELKSLLTEIPPEWRAEVTLVSLTGMRPGELYELCWSDVDFTRRTMTVQRAHYAGHVGETKTGKIKEIPFNESVDKILREQRWFQLQEQSQALATGLVFPASEQGKTNWRRRASSLHKTLRRAAQAADINVHVTPQVIRRTFNTLMKDTGVNSLTVMDIMGHSSEVMTAHYHSSTEPARRAALLEYEKRLKE